ncbi:hypothetical protein [Streptomyces minutiscleroticus]|uniref:Uncharacterized protein n=1 Tax=Streptomyces minutiscleroticus TaxID=68238 RepID=A0A918NQB1_9ACTN|nr:hypothetical protein [Streptomyces minutiscleroticus]GGX86750.1 hypothetical protein GCM10010358_46000 [Streptomyces minutiscleroticus]
MLVRLACIAVTHAFTALRPIPMSDHDKDVEILALRHRLAVLHRRPGDQRLGFQAADRVFLTTAAGSPRLRDPIRGRSPQPVVRRTEVSR